jgi:hypothetical protein
MRLNTIIRNAGFKNLTHFHSISGIKPDFMYRIYQQDMAGAADIVATYAPYRRLKPLLSEPVKVEIEVDGIMKVSINCPRADLTRALKRANLSRDQVRAVLLAGYTKTPLQYADEQATGELDGYDSPAGMMYPVKTGGDK